MTQLTGLQQSVSSESGPVSVTGAIAHEARVGDHAVDRRRALDPVAGKHAAAQRHPQAVGPRIEPQREAPGLRDRNDGFIDKADGRDKPVDIKPQAREVPIEGDGAVDVEAEGDQGGEIRLDFAARLAATKQAFAFACRSTPSSAAA